MPPSQLFFVGLPLLLIVVLALIATCRFREEELSRFQVFFCWVAAYSMGVAAAGFLGAMVVFTWYGGIPGSASDGGLINGQYYFNWHDETYTQVSRQTWQRAYVLEQLATRALWVGFSCFAGSFAILFLTRRLVQPSTASKGSTRAEPHYE